MDMELEEIIRLGLQVSEPAETKEIDDGDDETYVRLWQRYESVVKDIWSPTPKLPAQSSQQDIVINERLEVLKELI